MTIDLLLAYYGDDFTGSTDVLESLTRGGVETVLFTEPPSVEMLRRYPRARAIGVAGHSRTMSPGEMDAALPAVFAALRDLRPAIVHYKVSSTFDSSPDVGSIGRAIDIACGVFDNRYVPLVVGSPNLQRFCVFGNLFARSGLGSPVYRLDRHPTMSCHPTTPMTEADLRVHLARQTDRPVGLVDVLALDSGAAAAAVADASREPGSIVLFDTLCEAHLATAGECIWTEQQRAGKPLIVAGSSGMDNALTAHWVAAGLLADPPQYDRAPRRVDRVLAVSGSCSPVTERQIAWAVARGFVEVPLDTTRLVRANESQVTTEVQAVAEQVVAALDAGCSVIVHTSRGPEDSRIGATKQSAPDGLTAKPLGGILGRVLGAVLASRRVARVAVTGGDTSGYVARTVGIEALEMASLLTPGAPLCVARSRRPEVDGVEFTFKGGQVGFDDFFGTLLGGSQ